VILVVVLLSVPPLILFVPLAVVILVVLYFIFARNQQRARAIAQSHLAAGTTSILDVELSPGLNDSLVLNDWGIVCVRWLKRPVELAWNEITLVDEPATAMLEIHSARYAALRLDLSQDRYFLATETIHAKIPQRTDFNIDAVTGESRLLVKLEKTPFEWRGRWGNVAVSKHGIEHNQHRIAWHEIGRVGEVRYELDETKPFDELTFTSDTSSVTIRSTWFDDGRQVGNSGYDLIKAIVAERIPGKIPIPRGPTLPKDRAAEEFKRCQEAYRVGFIYALRSGKLDYFDKPFAHMLALVDKFSLEDSVDTQSFFRDCAELLSRTGRAAEAAQIEARAASR
jgi:hypothetical protein